MSATPRTFKLPGKNVRHIRGDDVKAWQKDVKKLFKSVGINCPIVVDGIYAQETRGYTATLCKAFGLVAKTAMKDGVTPELRIKLRNKDLNAAEKKRFEAQTTKAYRAQVRDRWRERKVHPPITKITTDAWGFQVGGHDGVDVTGVRPGLPVFAMVKCKVIDVRMGNWWGASPSGVVSEGDGIVQVQVLETVGPFRKGDHIGYGHTEQPNNKPIVKVGQILEAGDQLGSLGLAVTPHIHLMANHGEVGNQGRGTFDPRRMLDYSVKHG